jgi:hypothetical protein
MKLNEAKTILENSGYQLIKESSNLQAQKEYSWNGSKGAIFVSEGKRATVWVSITNDNKDEELDTVALPAMYKNIETKYGLKAISAQDFPYNQNGFNMVVVYAKTKEIDLGELCEDIYQALNVG